MSEILEISEIVPSMDDDGQYSAPLETQNQSSEEDAQHNANEVALDLKEKVSNNSKEQNCLVGQLGEENLASNVFISETSSTGITATSSLQIDHDIEHLSDTMLKELNKGIRLMVQCSKQFRIKKHDSISEIEKLKITLLHILKQFKYSDASEIKTLKTIVRNELKVLCGTLRQISKFLLQVHINGRIGIVLYDELITKNLDQLETKTNVLTEEHHKNDLDLGDVTKIASVQYNDQGLVLVLIPKSDKLFITGLNENWSLSFEKLEFDKKILLLKAVFDEINQHSGQLWFNLKQFGNYLKKFKSKAEAFGAKAFKTPKLDEFSMECNITLIHDQLTGLEANYVDHLIIRKLKNLSETIKFFNYISDKSANIMQQQEDAFGTVNAKKDHIINGKDVLQGEGRKETIKVHLAKISMDDIEALLKDEIIEDMYQGMDMSDVSVEFISDDGPQAQAKLQNWIYRLIYRIREAILYWTA